MKHLDARATYLLKLLAKAEGGTKKAVAAKPKAKKKAAVVKDDPEDLSTKEYISKEIIEDEDSSDSDDKHDKKVKKKKDEKDKKKGL